MRATTPAAALNADPSENERKREGGKAPRVSVIIPTRNRPGDLRSTAEGVLNQTEPPDELIIVDQSESDASAGAIAKLFETAPLGTPNRPRLIYVRDSSLSGVAEARNRGIELAHGDIWLFLDDDVELEPDFIRELIAAYEQCPEATGISGIITNYAPPPLPYRIWSRIFVRGPFRDDRQSIYWRARSLQNSDPVPVSRLGGGLMSFRATAVAGVRFDENLTGVCDGEDVDFCMQLRPSALLLIAPRARLLHKQSATGRAQDHWLRRSAQASYYLFRRHWRTRIVNRLHWFWMSAGFGLMATLAGVRHASLVPWRALIHGYNLGCRLSENASSTVRGAERRQPASEHPERVSIIIATKDRPSELRTVLESILRQPLLPTEVIVVDQSVADDGRRAAADLFSMAATEACRSLPLVYIHDPLIPGLTAARNVGMSIAQGEVWAFLDDDVELEPRYIEEILRAYRDHPEAAGISGTITNLPRLDVSFRRWLKVFARGPFHDDRLSAYPPAAQLPQSSPIEVTRFIGACMSFRANAARDFRFGESLTGCDGDDVDFCLKLGRAGKLLIAPHARLAHNQSPIGRAQDHWLRFLSQANCCLYRRNWRTGAANRMYFFWLNVGFTLAALYSCARWRSPDAWRALTAGRCLGYAHSRGPLPNPRVSAFRTPAQSRTMSACRKMHAYVRELSRCGRAAGPSVTARYALLTARKTLGIPEPATYLLHPRQVRHPLKIRLRGSSDMDIFDQIFTSHQHSSLKDLKDVDLVFDLGANIGLSSAYFLSCFPRARLVAIEPDNGNVALCMENLRPYGDRALVLHGAVWSRCTEVGLVKGRFGDGREWTTQVAEIEKDEKLQAKVQAWSMPALIDMAGGGPIDLLKIDIERAELSIFVSAASAWLPRVRNICIELHGPDCEQAFFAALTNFEYCVARSGELTVCRNLREKAKTPYRMPGVYL